MNPSVYLYNATDAGFELYFGQFCTSDGLSLLEPENEITITALGATCYKNYGWATQNDVPIVKTVGEFLSFLDNEGDIALIECEILIKDIGILKTHDDCECHFTIQRQEQFIKLLRSACPDQHRDLLIHKLVTNPGIYLTCDKHGKIEKYDSFDRYLTENA